VCSPEAWDDALADAVAMVEAELAEDAKGIVALLRQGNPYSMTITLAKLLSEVVTEQEVSPSHFREWAGRAVNRP
jgi:hypothetical protein